MARDVRHAERLPHLAPAGTEVVRVAPRARGRRKDHRLLAEDTNAAARSQDCHRECRQRQRSPACGRLRLVDPKQALPGRPNYLACDCQRPSVLVEIGPIAVRAIPICATPVAMNNVIGSTDRDVGNASDARNLTSRPRNSSRRQRGRTLWRVFRLDRRDVTHRVRSDDVRHDRQVQPPLRIVLDCTAITSPCARRIERMAASTLAGVASPTRTPAMILPRSLAQ